MEPPSNFPGALLLICALFILIPLLWLITTANRFTKLKNHIRESWSNVDVALKRRHDLIPNLVETVKAYAAHESALFESVARAREHAELASNSGVKAQAIAESELVAGTNMILARAEAYPELKASANFLQLQQELTNTEDRIAAARRFYNANVRDFNTMLDSFPASIIGHWQGHSEAPFFEVEDLSVRQSIPVSF